MTLVLKHNKLKQMLKTHYQLKMPLFIQGGFGIGKSDVVRQTTKDLATEKNLEFVEWNKLTNDKRLEITKNPKGKFILIDIRLSDRDPTDIKGLPDLSNENGYVEWKVELWVKAISNPEFDGILFFDEMNNAPPSVLKTAYQIFLDRQVGEYPISDNVLLLGAGNRIEDRADIFDVPLPLRDRYNEVELQTDDEVWTEWANNNGIHGMVISFIGFKQDRLLAVDEDKQGKSTTPRGWERVSKILRTFELPDEPEDEKYDELERYVAATVGESSAKTFIAYAKLQKNINLREILENPKLVDNITEMSLKYALIGGIVEIYRANKEETLPKAVGVCEYLPPEFTTLFLRMLNGVDQVFFKRNISKQKLWKERLLEEYGKYLA